MLGQKPGTTAFGQSNVDERNDHAPQVEDANQIGGCQRHLGHQRPVQNFFYIENWEAKTLATAAEHAVLRFGRGLFQWAESFEQLGAVGVGGERCQMKIVEHFVSTVSLGEPSHSSQKLFTSERLGDVTVRALLLTLVAIARRALG